MILLWQPRLQRLIRQKKWDLVEEHLQKRPAAVFRYRTRNVPKRNIIDEEPYKRFCKRGAPPPLLMCLDAWESNKKYDEQEKIPLSVILAIFDAYGSQESAEFIQKTKMAPRLINWQLPNHCGSFTWEAALKIALQVGVSVRTIQQLQQEFDGNVWWYFDLLEAERAKWQVHQEEKEHVIVWLEQNAIKKLDDQEKYRYEWERRARETGIYYSRKFYTQHMDDPKVLQSENERCKRDENELAKWNSKVKAKRAKDAAETAQREEWERARKAKKKSEEERKAKEEERRRNPTAEDKRRWEEIRQKEKDYQQFKFNMRYYGTPTGDIHRNWKMKDY